jgi:hypothetical protein
MKSKRVHLLLFLMLSCWSFNACKPSEKNSKKELSIETEAVDTPEMPSMDKDAIRVKVRIEAIETQSATENVYIITLQEVVKYGATFATIEPKVGDKLSLYTPSSVRFTEGESVEIDVKTPLKKMGNLLNVTWVQN